MTAPENLSILVPAAGEGSRLGMGPKALIELGGKALIVWLTEKLRRLSDDIIIATPRGKVDQFQTLCPSCLCVEGGASRQESISKLYSASTGDWLLISDATRPFASIDLYRRTLERGLETGASGAFMKSDVPVAKIINNQIVDVLKSDEAGIFQTPNVFSRDVFADILEKTTRYDWQEQSTMQLAINAGYNVSIVKGEKHNIKLTTETDWLTAQSLIDYLK